jgi:hypothetical protein
MPMAMMAWTVMLEERERDPVVLGGEEEDGVAVMRTVGMVGRVAMPVEVEMEV